jgi:hypothetical protein
MISKKLIYAAMVLQILLFLWGIYDLMLGRIFLGIFQIVINSTFFIVNISNLKRIS